MAVAIIPCEESDLGCGSDGMICESRTEALLAMKASIDERQKTRPQDA